MEVIAFIIFAALQIADSITTDIILRNGRELNPILNWLFNKFGIVPTLVVFKLVSLLLVATVWNFWLMVVLDVIFSGVVAIARAIR